MASALRPGSVLAPPCHASVDQRRICGKADVGPERQALHYARTKSLDQGIRADTEASHHLLTCGLFQIHGNGAAVARQQVLARVDVEAGGWRARPVDADDLSAKVASSMAAKGTGPIAAISISMVPAS